MVWSGSLLGSSSGDETTWVSFRRYSSFKKKSDPLEGIVGHVEYAGPIEEFLPLLEMGQLTHVGNVPSSGWVATGC
jgi:CRISPR-associated endoribonuclease Cas6